MTTFKRFDELNEDDNRWRAGEPPTVDEVGKFWVVMKPDHDSTIGDILFDTTVYGFIIQHQGGLKQDEIYGLYTDSGKARAKAESLLSNGRKRS
jgi:hypothetical protein